MISGVSGASSYQLQTQSSRETKLTDEQKLQLEEILSKYDSSSITSDQTKTLFDELKSSGIRPGKEVREIIDAAGFKPPEKPEGPPPPEQKVEETQQLPDYLLEFLEKQSSGELTQSDLNSLITELQNNGEVSQGVLVDKKV
ncbi:MAG: hypothetical protein WCZ90_09690 [Melioribacteraceae bacterium]